MDNKYRVILVIGENHEEIVKKYSLDNKLYKYVKMNINEAEEERLEHMNLIELLLTDKRVRLTSKQRDDYKDEYLRLKNLSTLDYFDEQTADCLFDENTGEAITDINPNAHYQYERCQQHRLEVTGEEGDFSDPFPLKDGTKSYSAKFNDIDWKQIHHNEHKINISKRVWELAVEDDVPKNEQEEELKSLMMKRKTYFDNFKNCDEFVKHSTSLWYWGVATEESYTEIDHTISDYDWIVNFYDRFIEPLIKTNDLITIYEVKGLD